MQISEKKINKKNLPLTKKNINLLKIIKMKIEDRLLNLVKKEFLNKNILGVRFVKKTSESSWEFRYIYQDGNYLSLSELKEAFLEGINLKLVHKSEKKQIKKQINKKVK